MSTRRSLVFATAFSNYSIDIIRNKLHWVGAYIPTAEEATAEVAGLDGPDPQRDWPAVASFLRTLRTSPGGQHAERHRTPASSRGRAQSAVAERGAETALY